jgi:hypothetical protein
MALPGAGEPSLDTFLFKLTADHGHSSADGALRRTSLITAPVVGGLLVRNVSSCSHQKHAQTF